MNIIETHDLCKQYGNALRVAHLDLDVPEGSVYGFLGPNGAGKSTTLKMILGLVLRVPVIMDTSLGKRT